MLIVIAIYVYISKNKDFWVVGPICLCEKGIGAQQNRNFVTACTHLEKSGQSDDGQLRSNLRVGQTAAARE